MDGRMFLKGEAPSHHPLTLRKKRVHTFMEQLIEHTLSVDPNPYPNPHTKSEVSSLKLRLKLFLSVIRLYIVISELEVTRWHLVNYF